MKKLLLALFIGTVLICGCAAKKTVLYAPGMKVEENRQNGAVSIQTKDGNATIGAVDEKELGVPIYPGATVTSGMSFSGTPSAKSGAIVFADTTDSVDKVAAYYLQHIPGAKQTMKVSGPTGSMVSISVRNGQGRTIGVNITGDSNGKQTHIMIGNEPK